MFVLGAGTVVGRLGVHEGLRVGLCGLFAEETG